MPKPSACTWQVGSTQVLAFDLLDELVPTLGEFTLVDVDLDEAKAIVGGARVGLGWGVC